MSAALVFVRSLVFALIQIVLTVIFGIIAVLSFPLPPHTRYRIVTVWTHCVLWLRTISHLPVGEMLHLARSSISLKSKSLIYVLLLTASHLFL